MQKIKELPVVLVDSPVIVWAAFVNLMAIPQASSGMRRIRIHLLFSDGNRQDQAGNTFPLFVKALSVTTSAVYQYIDIPFIAGLGLNEFAVRLPPAWLEPERCWRHFCWDGSGGVKGWGCGRRFCLFFAPSILLSRWANQSSLLTLCPAECTLSVTGMDLKPGNAWQRFSFVLALYTYATARLFIPVFVFLLGFVRVEWRGWSSEQKLAYFRKFFCF